METYLMSMVYIYKPRSRGYPGETIADADFIHDIELLVNTSVSCIVWNR